MSKQQSTPRMLYLPIELSSRELLSKLLIGLQAAEAGIPTILGQMWLLNKNLPRLDPGFVMFKSVQRLHVKGMRTAKSHGHGVGVIDEEALAWAEDQELSIEVAPDLFGTADVLFAHGPKHHQALVDRFPMAENQVVVTGNPRTDLLRPELAKLHQVEAERIKQEYGSFLLINTNFGNINSIWGGIERSFQIWVNVGVLDPNKDYEVQRFKDICSFENANKNELMKVLSVLDSKLSTHKIIIRPHQVEKPEPWEDLQAKARNIKVVHEGSSIPWMLASDLLLHPVCTTGMEALLLGAPALSLKAGENPWHQRFLSNFINPTADTAEQAVTMILKHLSGEQLLQAGRDQYWETMKTYLSATEGTLASEAIAKWLSEWFTDRGFTPPTGPVEMPATFIPDMDRNDVLRTKMSTTLDDFNAGVDGFRRAFDRFENIQGRQIGDSLFLLERV